MNDQLIPSLSALKLFSQMLSSQNIPHALGGSGLIFALGGSCTVHDWDLTMHTTWDKLQNALNDIPHQYLKCDGIFATDFRCNLNFLDANFDLMNAFAIKDQNDIYRMPLKVTGHWNGVPLGCPEEWIKVYGLINRPEKVKLLEDCLAKLTPQEPVDQSALDELCQRVGHSLHCHHK